MDHVQIINDQIKAAMLSGEKLRLETLRSLRAGIIEFEKSGTDKKLGDEDFLKIVSSNVKKRRDSIEQFRSANRPEMLEKEEKELAILLEFMPTQLSQEEVQKTVNAIAESLRSAGTALDFRNVMPAVMKELKGKADGAVIQAAVKSVTSS